MTTRWTPTLPAWWVALLLAAPSGGVAPDRLAEPPGRRLIVLGGNTPPAVVAHARTIGEPAELRRSLTALRTSSEWETAHQLLWWALREAPQLAQPIHCNIVLAALSEARQWQLALILLEHMEAAGLPRDAYSFSAAICACARAGEPQAAVNTFKAMCSAEVPPSSVAFNTALAAAQRAPDRRKAAELVLASRCVGGGRAKSPPNPALPGLGEAVSGSGCAQQRQRLSHPPARRATNAVLPPLRRHTAGSLRDTTSLRLAPSLLVSPHLALSTPPYPTQAIYTLATLQLVPDAWASAAAVRALSDLGQHDRALAMYRSLRPSQVLSHTSMSPLCPCALCVCPPHPLGPAPLAPCPMHRSLDQRRFSAHTSHRLLPGSHPASHIPPGTPLPAPHSRHTPPGTPLPAHQSRRRSPRTLSPQRCARRSALPTRERRFNSSAMRGSEASSPRRTRSTRRSALASPNGPLAGAAQSRGGHPHAASGGHGTCPTRPSRGLGTLSWVPPVVPPFRNAFVGVRPSRRCDA